MRATNTASAKGATTPAAAPVLKRQMKAHLVKLWQTVGQAGAFGITVKQLCEMLPDAQAKQISTALSYMRTLKYVDVSGGRAKGARWFAAGVPVGQEPPAWMRAPEMPRQATSVFALAAAPVPTDWTLRGRRTPPPRDAQLRDEDDDDHDQVEASTGVDIDAAHLRTGSLNWVAPPAEQCKPPVQLDAKVAVPAPPSTHTPPPPYLPEGTPRNAPPAPAADPRLQPHFALHSDGTLQLCVEGDGNSVDVILQPDTTRALFRWLDRLGGTHLSRIAEGA